MASENWVIADDEVEELTNLFTVEVTETVDVLTDSEERAIELALQGRFGNVKAHIVQATYADPV